MYRTVKEKINVQQFDFFLKRNCRRGGLKMDVAPWLELLVYHVPSTEFNFQYCMKLEGPYL